MKRSSLPLGSVVVAAALLAATPAAASNVLEYPDNGVAQFSRGGAWLATATDPIAAHYNPAALATQPTSLGLGWNLPMQQICYTRKGPGDTSEYPSETWENQGFPAYPTVCNAHSGFPRFVPNGAFTWRASEKLGLGLAVVPPSSYGKLDWPLSVEQPGRAGKSMPAPMRYMSLGTEGTILMPTLSFGYEVASRLRIGAGFVSGIAILKLQSGSLSQADIDLQRDNLDSDNRSIVEVKDMFWPGFVLSAHWSATENIDVALWYRFMDKIKANGNISVATNPFTRGGELNKVCDPAPEGAQKDPTCSYLSHSDDTVGEDKTHVTITVPMELRTGIRWHKPLAAPTPLMAEKFRVDPYAVRDPLRDDLYDLELDLSWANNSAASDVKVVNDPPYQPYDLASLIPADATRPTGFKDSFGARLGGQFGAIRNLLGIRWGTWIETAAVDAEYLSVTGVPALRGGFGGGFVVRIQAVDIEGGYQHIWNAGLDNHGDGQLKAIAGTPATPDPNFNLAAGRSYHSINGGSIKQHANVISMGAVVRF